MPTLLLLLVLFWVVFSPSVCVCLCVCVCVLYLAFFQPLPRLQENGQGDKQALVMAKFLEQLYHNVSAFQQQVAISQEYTDSLAATLFLPSSIVNVQEGEDKEEDEVSLLGFFPRVFYM